MVVGLLRIRLVIMKYKVKGILVLLLLMAGTDRASASTVKILVSDNGQFRGCESRAHVKDPWMTSYRATSEELRSFVAVFLQEKPNRELIDAGLVNAGIVFCGALEAEKFAEFLLAQLNTSKVPRRLMPMIMQYKQLHSFQLVLKRLLASDDISGAFRANLLRISDQKLQ